MISCSKQRISSWLMMSLLFIFWWCPDDDLMIANMKQNDINDMRLTGTNIYLAHLKLFWSLSLFDSRSQTWNIPLSSHTTSISFFFLINFSNTFSYSSCSSLIISSCPSSCPFICVIHLTLSSPRSLISRLVLEVRINQSEQHLN